MWQDSETSIEYRFGKQANGQPFETDLPERSSCLECAFSLPTYQEKLEFPLSQRARAMKQNHRLAKLGSAPNFAQRAISIKHVLPLTGMSRSTLYRLAKDG